MNWPTFYHFSEISEHICHAVIKSQNGGGRSYVQHGVGHCFRISKFGDLLCGSLVYGLEKLPNEQLQHCQTSIYLYW